MRFLLICLVGLVFGCGDGDRSVGPVQGPAAVGDGLSVESVESLESLESLAALGVSAGKAVVSADSARYGRAFLLASGSGNLGIVELLVRLGADVSATDEAGNTALHLSAANGHLDVVEFLVGQGLAVGAVNDAGETAGALASAAGHIEVADYLESLVEEEEVEVVRTPSAARAALDSLGIDYTERAFLRAARDGDLDVVKLFVWAGMSVETANNRGYTALHWAAWKGHLSVVEFLVGAGADVDATDSGGKTAGALASAAGHGSVADYLAPLAGEVVEETEVVRTPEEARAELARRGIPYTADAFVRAAASGYLAVVKLFVQAGMSLEARNEYGHTALISATMGSRLSVMKYLVEQGASLTARDNYYGNTALHFAAWNGYLAVVKYLVEQGANVNAKNNLAFFQFGVQVSETGLTPRDLASNAGHDAVADYLESVGG